MKPKNYAYIGIVSAVISLIIAPVVFGPIAVILGYLAMRKGEKQLGLVAVILGIVLAIISWIIATMLLMTV